MKANQKFVTDNEAVSPVIGVILMVAITVVLAAVVFVLVQDLGGGSDNPETAAVSVTSPAVGEIHVLLVTEGDSAPYDNADVIINVNGQKCGASGDGSFSAGEVIVITSGTGCTFTNVDDVPVTVSLAGTAVYTGTVDVKSA